jgi:hypothetical protein
LGDIVEHDGQYFVVVEYREDPGTRYRVIPLDSRTRRRGDAVWMPSWKLLATGERSGTASVKTYRANLSMEDRGCECQCCIHEAYGLSEWTNYGRWRDSS